VSADPSGAEREFTLVGATVVTMNPTRDVLTDGYVSIRDGAITEVGPGTPATAGGRTWDLRGRIVLPGFVNTHAHLVSALTRGLGGDRFLTGGLPGGRERAHAIRESLDADMAYAGARLALSELMMSGVTTTTDSYAARRGLEDGLDGALRAWAESGMRGTLYRASVDRTEIVPGHRHDLVDLARSELDRLSNEWNSDLLTVGAEAMALHRVSRELLDALNDWAAANGAPFAMHISYTEDAADYAVTEHGLRLMTLLEEWGVLNDRFLGHHPVWVDEAEIEAIARTAAGVSVCSSANMLIGLAAAPIAKLIDVGARVSLGTDQPNDGHNFFEVMKATLLQQRAADGSTAFGSPELMLELATIGGARALHLDDRIGSIETGKQADLVILDATRPSLGPIAGRISDIVYAASPAEVETVVVAGRVVVERGRPTAWGLEEVVGEADRLTTKALTDAGLDPEPLTTWPVVPGPGPD
jgi:5-methylthioadenosine/S-adenosylhomocysteine deaminase